jgi:hypothetical protein
MKVIVVEDIHGGMVRINLDTIVSYSSLGDYTIFETTNGKIIETVVRIEDIDTFIEENT